MRVIFFGTPIFAAKVLEFLLEKGIEITAVVTQPDRPKGRSLKLEPPPVKKVAKEHSIPIYQPKSAAEEEFASCLRAVQPELFVVVAYGQIMKQNILDIPNKGCINLHASLLPKYRGAAPIQWSIINGESETGVTIMRMVKKMDAGEIISQERVPIQPSDSFLDVEAKLCDIGKGALLDVIHQLERGDATFTQQDDALATFAPKITSAACLVDWRRSDEEIHCLIRGVSPSPGAWCPVEIRGKRQRLKILRAHVVDQEGVPKQLLGYDDQQGVVVACGRGALSLEHVQLEGKKPMKIHDFIHGIRKQEFKII